MFPALLSVQQIASATLPKSSREAQVSWLTMAVPDSGMEGEAGKAPAAAHQHHPSLPSPQLSL